MATDSSKYATKATKYSPDSYIGSLISIISKSEIRYEGVIFHIDAQECTVGLNNVRSFGTEGRRKDGPQVPGSDKVYEYIRGTDIKDLQVLSSPTIQSATLIHDDPGIIQSHYLPPAPTSGSMSLPSSATGSVTSLSSNTQLGLPEATFQGSLHQYQPERSVGPWGSYSSPTVNSNEHSTQIYLQAFNKPLILQQQSLPQSIPGSVMSSFEQQQMQYSTTNISPSDALPNFSKFPHTLLLLHINGTLGLMSNTAPYSSMSLNHSVNGSAYLVSGEPPHQIENNVPMFPIVTSTSSLPPVTPLSSSDLVTNVNQTAEQPKVVVGSTSSVQGVAISTPSVTGTSSSDHTKASPTSLATADKLLQSMPAKLASAGSLKTAQKDIEVVQASTSESLRTDSKDASEPKLTIKSEYIEKFNKTPSHSQSCDRGNERGIIDGGREYKLNRHASLTHHGDGVRAQGRGNRLYGATSHAPFRHNEQPWGVKNQINGPALLSQYGSKGQVKGRANKISHAVTKFMEDFDFATMNEKFNKDEIWGELGKSNKYQGSGNDSDEDDKPHKDADRLSKVERKPFYVKENFFDSLSCNSPNYGSEKGNFKRSEQRKLDTETFGHFRVSQGARSGCRNSCGGWSRGYQHGRGYGSVRRGQGRVMWSRVT